MFLFDLIIFILILGLIITIHEFGHFIFAKRAGILCHEFSIGMGPAIVQKRKGETIYSIRAIPIGGYVAMAGESVSDALFKKGNQIGLNLNSQDQVTEIILTNEIESQIIGEVIDYDLYGKNFEPLYIDLKTDDGVIRYQVIRQARYRLTPKKEQFITPAEKSFEAKSIWERFIVIFAGPAMNFILALLLYLIVGFFMLKPNTGSSEIGAVNQDMSAHNILKAGDKIVSINGQPINSWSDIGFVMSNHNNATVSLLYTREGIEQDPVEIPLYIIIQTAGIRNYYENNDGTKPLIDYNSTIIGEPFGRAKEAGLQNGDEILRIKGSNNTWVTINNWADLINFFRINERGLVSVVVLRDGTEREFDYNLISKQAIEKLGNQAIVMQMGITTTGYYDIVYSVTYPFRAIGNNMSQIFNTLGLLFTPSEKLGIGDLSGPVGIFSLVSQTTSQGLLAIISFTAFLSINIGLINLLPLPALDGGRIVFLGVEAIIRRPLPRKFENSVNSIMFILLLGLFVFVTYRDILRLFL
ncbi:MAG: RIP metalloprotease RseP [Acholeplasmataceae bacterium]